MCSPQRTCQCLAKVRSCLLPVGRPRLVWQQSGCPAAELTHRREGVQVFSRKKSGLKRGCSRRGTLIETCRGFLQKMVKQVLPSMSLASKLCVLLMLHSIWLSIFTFLIAIAQQPAAWQRGVRATAVGGKRDEVARPLLRMPEC